MHSNYQAIDPLSRGEISVKRKRRGNRRKQSRAENEKVRENEKIWRECGQELFFPVSCLTV